MASGVGLSADPTAIIACTVSRDVQNFDLLIEDMEAELGERWGDLTFRDALPFFNQPEAQALEFVAVAMDAEDEGELELIEQIIKTAKDKKIKVILIAEDVGPSTLHQLMRGGADDFCPYPLPENALQEAITRIRSKASAPRTIVTDDGEVISTGPKPGDRDGAILAVHGMAGGVGSTTIAVNLAWELAIATPVGEKAKPPKVCLLDLDLQFGAVATYLDLSRREQVYEFLSDTSNLNTDNTETALQLYAEKLSVLTAPADMLPLDIVTAEDMTKILDQLRRMFDFIVIDMPKTVVPWSESVLNASNLYFNVLELDMRSAQNTLRLIRALKAEELPVEKLRFILNRAPKFTDLTGKARVRRMAESLDIKIELQFPDGGLQVTEAGDHGQPMSENFGKNPLRKEVAKLAQSLVELTQAKAVAAE